MGTGTHFNERTPERKYNLKNALTQSTDNIALRNDGVGVWCS